MFIGVAAAHHQGADRSNVGSCPECVKVDQNLVSAPFVVFLQCLGPMMWVWTRQLLGRGGVAGFRPDWTCQRGAGSEGKGQSLTVGYRWSKNRSISCHTLSPICSCFHRDARLRILNPIIRLVTGHMTQAGSTPAFENTRSQI